MNRPKVSALTRLIISSSARCRPGSGHRQCRARARRGQITAKAPLTRQINCRGMPESSQRAWRSGRTSRRRGCGRGQNSAAHQHAVSRQVDLAVDVAHLAVLKINRRVEKPVVGLFHHPATKEASAQLFELVHLHEFAERATLGPCQQIVPVRPAGQGRPLFDLANLFSKAPDWRDLESGLMRAMATRIDIGLFRRSHEGKFWPSMASGDLQFGLRGLGSYSAKQDDVTGQGEANDGGHRFDIGQDL